MFKRKPTPAPASAVPAASAVSAEADVSRVLGDLLAKPTQESVLSASLSHAAALLGGQVRGLGILRRGQDRVGAVMGYPRELIGVELSGPWSAGRTRLLEGGARELYEANGPELAPLFDGAGMRSVGLSLVVPITDRGRHLGALLLDRVAEGGIGPQQQEAVGRFGQAVGPLMGLIDGRDEWRQAARQITATVVEALESRDFDALGHARSVAEVAVSLGRGAGLAGRELDELWYAATLHDLGKIQGESGHALVGANLLSGIPALGEAERGVRHHHERWDGQGEPDRLSGEDIPLYARIVAVANAYVRLGDVKRVQAQSGKALDPRLVGVLEKYDKQKRS
ncbi:HD domain-containing protein [Deinococcus radiomollis]|uniref:HD-GYP domain-containing protein n=1 Tax=Deinococcus radiomollis TaxID=468916 RepID=UPI003891C1A7